MYITGAIFRPHPNPNPNPPTEDSLESGASIPGGGAGEGEVNRLLKIWVGEDTNMDTVSQSFCPLYVLRTNA